MDDGQIIDLYWERSEAAVSETAKKYGKYCHYIANNILHNREDAEECTNDTYLHAWNSMPDARPEMLKTFLGKITRNLSLHRYEQSAAKKRGGNQIPLVFDELAECIPSPDSSSQITERLVLAETMNAFLAKLPENTRKIFVRRYFYFASIAEIAAAYGFHESKVKMSLLRSRKELKELLEKEGVLL